MQLQQVDYQLVRYLETKLTALYEKIQSTTGEEWIDQLFPAIEPEIRDLWIATLKEKPLPVIQGFPQSNEPELPLLALNFKNEQEMMNGYVGDNGMAASEVNGVLLTTQMQIECWATQGQIAAFMYHLVKWMILSDQEKLREMGLVYRKMSGQDLPFLDPRLYGNHYRRALIVEFLSEVQWENPYNPITTIIDTSA
ncbi:hypothetical protein IC620_09540 [Hazenella sp. IB182357]|uniref:Uncharacterized protein n=1 Tax=Polycladospora coralii TaxID=2771432 RepID=A0A926N6P6_9BACL|nr:hypothetical protein [Polycladospora coralii]MBD1372596.1 hypothetical protein [Polycladospora coralii]